MTTTTDGTETRVCITCRQRKALADCYYHHARGPGGRSSKCKACTMSYQREYKRRRASRARFAAAPPVAQCVSAHQGGTELSIDEALLRTAAACQRWAEADDQEEREAAREAAVYRARQLVEAVGG